MSARGQHPNSLANLRPGAGQWQAGTVTHLKHGLRSRRPGRLLLDAASDEIVDALEAAVPLRGPDGEMLAAFRPMVEATAVLLIQVRRCSAYLELHGDTDAQGNLRPEVEGLDRTVMRFVAALDKLGATPVSYGRLGFDVARTAREAVDPAIHYARQAQAEAEAEEDDDRG